MLIGYLLMAFGVEALFLLVFNFLIFLAIMFQPVLRKQKQYIMIAGLALTDGIQGFGGTTEVLNSLIISQMDTLRSRWQCLLMPWNLSYLLSTFAGPLMMMAISCDRLLSVAIPLRYYTFNAKYAQKWVGSVYGVTVLHFLILGGLIFGGVDKQEILPFCFYYEVVPSLTWQLGIAVVVFGGIGSVVVYFLAFVMYRMKRNTGTVMPAGHMTELAMKNLKKDLKIQRKLLTTFGISATCTLALSVIPYFMQRVVEYLELFDESSFISYDDFTLIVYMIFCLNLMANFFIYTMRHGEIKKAVIYMFKWKKMSYVEFRKNQIK